MSFNRLASKNFGENNWCLRLQPLYQHGLLTSLSDGHVHLLDWKNLESSTKVQAHESSINDLKVLNSNYDTSTTYVTAANDSAKIWDVRSSGPIATIRNEKNSHFLSLDSRHDLLACGTELSGIDAELHIYDIRNFSKPLRSLIDSHHDDITDIKFHPCDKNLLLSGSTDGYVNIYDLLQDDEEDAQHQVINFASIHSCGWLGPKRIWTLSHMETFAIHELNDKSDQWIEPKPVQFGDIRNNWDCDYVVDIFPGFIATGKSHEQDGELKIIPFDNETVDLQSSIVLPNAHESEVVRDVLAHKEQKNTLYSCGEDGCVNIWRNTTNSLNLPSEFWDYSKSFDPFGNSLAEIDMVMEADGVDEAITSLGPDDETTSITREKMKPHGKKEKKNRNKKREKNNADHRFKPY